MLVKDKTLILRYSKKLFRIPHKFDSLKLDFYPVSISILALPMKESENMRTEQIKQMVMSRYDRFAETGGKQEEC